MGVGESNRSGWLRSRVKATKIVYNYDRSLHLRTFVHRLAETSTTEIAGLRFDREREPFYKMDNYSSTVAQRNNTLLDCEITGDEDVFDRWAENKRGQLLGILSSLGCQAGRDVPAEEVSVPNIHLHVHVYCVVVPWTTSQQQCQIYLVQKS